VRATLHDLPGVFDFSNVDLVNFQYFKNLASQDPRTAANANPFLEHFQKKKAVLDYLDRLFSLKDSLVSLFFRFGTTAWMQIALYLFTFKSKT